MTLLQEIEFSGVRDPRILAAFRKTDRALFVPEEFRERAYRDHPIPIERDQVTTQPTLVAKMIDALRLRGDEKILEVGTGWGYQAAVLSHLCREVISIERFADLADRAKVNLARAGVGNVHVLSGDGTLGIPDEAPFDAIVIAAAGPRVPAPLAEQLAEGGRLVQPIGPGGDEEVWVFRKTNHQLAHERLLTPASFVPLVGDF